MLCFLHNDTEMRDVRWLARLRAALEEPGVGLAGLYGVRRLRRDGRYVGRTIVHALDGSANLRADAVEVAAVDGVCLTRAPGGARGRSGASTRGTASSTATTASCRSRSARPGTAASW